MQGQAAGLDHLFECDRLLRNRLHGVFSRLLRGENHPFDQSAGQLNEFITARVIGGAQIALLDVEAIGQHGRGEPDIGDRFCSQCCELGWIVAVIGDQIFLARLRRGADQYVLSEARPGEIPCLGEIGDQGFGIGLRGGDARQNGLSQDPARGVFTQGGFEICLFEVVALQDLCIGLAIKFAIKPMESRDFNHLFTHPCIARRQAEISDQLIQSPRGDHSVQRPLIEANGLHFLWGDVSADLLLKLCHLVLQGGTVRGNGYGLITHFA